jgi:hypothetical protein
VGSEKVGMVLLVAMLIVDGTWVGCRREAMEGRLLGKMHSHLFTQGRSLVIVCKRTVEARNRF